MRWIGNPGWVGPTDPKRARVKRMTRPEIAAAYPGVPLADSGPATPIKMRFAGKCFECGEEIPVGTRATWFPRARKVRHVNCEAHFAELAAKETP